MNILFICDEYPPGKNGGIGSATRTLARELAKNGNNIYVVGLYPLNFGGADYEEDMGVKVWRLRHILDNGLVKNNFSRVDRIFLELFRWTDFLSNHLHKDLNKLYSFINIIVKEYNIDIIEWPDWNNYFKYLIKEIPRPVFTVPVVVKFHGTYSYIAKQMGRKINPLIYNLELQHISTANALVAVSKNTSIDMKELYGINREIQVLYNSIEVSDYSEYSLNREGQRVMYTGALSELKGVRSLMNAWNLVNERCPHATLELYGKGNKQNFSKYLSNKAFNSVQFKGHVDKSTLLEAFNRTSVAVFPSYTECFALGPLEAMSNGCPVIFTKRASGPELICDSINGFLIDPDNYEEIAEKIILLLNDKNLRLKFSSEGRKTITDNFTISKSASDHMKYYRTVISKYPN